MPNDSGGNAEMFSFLFTDIEGSVRLWNEDPMWMRAAIERHNGVLSTAVDAAGGRVFKTVGDAVCASFASPVDALKKRGHRAVAAQKEFEQDIRTITVRMAIHSGLAFDPIRSLARWLSF